MDTGKREGVVEGLVLALTGAEFNALRVWMESAGSVVSKAVLTRLVLHQELGRFDRSMEVHVSRETPHESRKPNEIIIQPKQFILENIFCVLVG